eukprot:3583810-Pyramimonas_sp.AAC.1
MAPGRDQFRASQHRINEIHRFQNFWDWRSRVTFSGRRVSGVDAGDAFAHILDFFFEFILRCLHEGSCDQTLAPDEPHRPMSDQKCTRTRHHTGSFRYQTGTLTQSSEPSRARTYHHKKCTPRFLLSEQCCRQTGSAAACR